MRYNAEHGWWFPDAEEHLPHWMSLTRDKKTLHGRSLYQHTKYDELRKHVPILQNSIPRKAVAVDIGAHVGLWTWMMLQDFQLVHCFEPHPVHRQCWQENILRAVDPAKVEIYPFALGNEEKVVHLRTRTENSSGDTGVEPGNEAPAGSIPVQQYKLDKFINKLGHVDLIKMDCEGYELWVCQGEEEVILQNRPTIIIEQKPGTGMEKRYGIGATDGVAFLESLGIHRIKEISGDYIMGW